MVKNKRLQIEKIQKIVVNTKSGYKKYYLKGLNTIQTKSLKYLAASVNRHIYHYVISLSRMRLNYTNKYIVIRKKLKTFEITLQHLFLNKIYQRI